MDLQIIKQLVGEITVYREQEPKPFVISKDVAILKNALQSPKLSVLDYDGTKGLLPRVMFLVGLKVIEIDRFTNIEKQAIVNFIQKKFGHITAAEFVNAFEMAIAGELDLKQSDVECYQNFTPLYIGKILNAYLEWAKKTYNANRHIFEKIEAQPVLKMTADWKESCEDAYQKFLKDKLNLDLMPVDLYAEFEAVKYIAKDLYEDYLVEAEATILHNLTTDLGDAKLTNNPQLVRALAVKIEGIKNADDCHFSVIALAKKLTAKALFQHSKEIGIEKLFDKEN